jgi:hypothetical protein
VIYLDANATTQPLPEVVHAVQASLERTWANPSSIHRPGQAARHQVELARSCWAAPTANWCSPAEERSLRTWPSAARSQAHDDACW